MSVKPIPERYHTVTPYLFLKKAAQAIEFYKKAFGAAEVMRMLGADGKIMHAELKIGNSIVMLADESPQSGRSPETLGGSSVSLHVYFENVDQVAEKAVAVGAKLIRPVQNQFYGDRTGTMIDPFGHMWSIATHVEDVSPEELGKRAAAAMSQSAGG